MRKIKPYVDVMVRLNFETGEVICPNEEAGSLLEKFIQDRMHGTPVDGEGKSTSNYDTSTESELYQKGYEQGKNWVVNNPGLFGLSTCRVMDREDIKCILDLERRLFSHDTWLEFKSRVASAIIKYLTERG